MSSFRLLCRLGPAFLAVMVVCGPARGADYLDPLDLPESCHPPVMLTIDPDWQETVLGYRESSLRTLGRALGSPQAARAELQRTLDLAERTRLHAFDVLATTRELVLRGFRGPELESTRLAVLDLHAARGPAPAERLLRVLGAVKDQGYLGPLEAQGLAEQVPEEVLTAALGERLGLRGEGVLLQVRERLKGRQVDAVLGTWAVLEGVRRQLQERALGQVAQRALSSCVETMSRACPRREAEASCRTTPREHLEILRR